MFIPITFAGLSESEGVQNFVTIFSDFSGFWYNFVFALLIILFTYFYTAITVNTNQMADDLKRNGGFVPGMTAGRGFIALGVVVLARWKPMLVLIFAFAFGLTQGLQFLGGRLDALSGIPPQFWTALPYVMTVIAVVFAPGSTYPAAVGIPYKRVGR